MSEPCRLIEIQDIRKSYDGRKNVLEDITFSLERGEIAVIYGPSGCGKSTLLNIIGLLDSFSSGTYRFEGRALKKNRINSYHDIRSKDMGFIFQSYGLIEAVSVKENILMPYLYNGKSADKTVMSELKKLMDEFDLAHLENSKASLLSGGEKQRVAICRAIIKNPKLIIADEPTGNLDDINTEIVKKAFDKMSHNGTSLVVVTHDRRLQFESSRSYILKNGYLQDIDNE